MTGRPTKLNDRALAAITADIRAGLPEGSAAARQRIGQRTLQDWLSRGAADIAADEDSIYAEAYLEVEHARADLVAGKVEQLNAALEVGGKDADGTVRGIMSFLMARFPDEWSEKRVGRTIDQTTRTVDAGSGEARTRDEIDAELAEAHGLRMVPVDDAPAPDEAAA